MNVTKGTISEIFNENVITVSLPHGELIPEAAHELKCDVYKESSGQQVIKVAFDDSQVLVGKQTAIGNIVNNYLVLRNKKTNKVKLVPIQNYVLSAPISEEKEAGSVTQLEKEQTFELALKFGSKKTKRVIEHYAQMRTDAETMEHKLKKMSTNVEVDSGVLNSQQEVKVQNYMPPIDRNAERLEDVYKLSHILTTKEMDILKMEAQKIMTNPEAYDKNSFTPFHLTCLENLSKLEEDKEKILEGVAILVYVNLLLKFLHCNAKVIAIKSFTSCSFSKEIHDRIMEEFTVMATTGRTRPMTMRDKTICYIIVLALIVNKYRLDLQPLATAERIPIKRLQQLSLLLGTVRFPKEPNVIVLRLPLPPAVKDIPYKRRQSKV